MSESIIKKSQFIVLPSDNTPDQMRYAAWQKLRDAGMTAKQVAELFGVNIATVTKYTISTVDFRHLRAEARREYYIPLMEKLRKRGYSNADIGKITGFCEKSVRSYIGVQPDETTLASHRAAGAKRHFRNVAGKNQPARDNNEPIPAVAEALTA